MTGSFKARGAMNRLLGAPAGEVANGIVTASGGNHGLAVARTAFVAGVPATIFLPSNVSPAKVAKIRRWKATVEIVGRDVRRGERRRARLRRAAPAPPTSTPSPTRSSSPARARSGSRSSRTSPASTPSSSPSAAAA